MKKTAYILMIMFLLPVLHSCEDWLDVNEDPVNITNVSADLVLPSVQLRMIREMTQHSYPLYYVQYLTKSRENTSIGSDITYLLTPGSANTKFNSLFAIMNDVQYIIDNTETGTREHYYPAIARVLKVMGFQMLVDLFGDVPYSDALAGGANLYPKYDNDREIYEAMYDLLDEASAIFNTAGNVGNLIQKDVFLSGNIDMWRRFTNTLKLRMLIRQSEIPERASYIQQKISALEKSFLEEGENVFANPGHVPNNNNMLPPYYWFWGKTFTGGDVANYANHRPSSVFVDFLQENNDPRMHIFLLPRSNTGTDPNASSEYAHYAGKRYAGIIPGHSSNEALSNAYASRQGRGIIYSPTQNSVVMTAAESFFLQAEAVQKGLMTGSAKALYQNGIEQSFFQYRVPFNDVSVVSPAVSDPIAAAQQYYSQTNVPDVRYINWDLASNKLAAIYYQKWVALFGHNAFESWTEFRRTGYPRLQLSRSVTEFNRHVARFPYTYDEELYNAENIPQGIDPFTSLIFWDKENPAP